MTKFPHLPLFVESYTSDAGHLTFEEHGMYLSLMMLMWKTPGCRIPNDMDWIRRRLRATEDEMITIDLIIDEFMHRTGNWITQKRLQKEYDYVQKSVDQKKNAAKSRWKKEKTKIESDKRKPLKNNETDVCKRNAPTPTLILDNISPPLVPPQDDEQVAVAPPSPKRKNGTRLSDDWQPDDDAFAFALDQIGAEKTHVEIEKFKDHWLSVSGNKATKVDWTRTWRNWIRRAAEYAASKGAGRGTADLVASVSAVGASLNRQSGLRADGLQAQPTSACPSPGYSQKNTISRIRAIAAANNPARADQAESQDQDQEYDDRRADVDDPGLLRRAAKVPC